MSAEVARCGTLQSQNYSLGTNREDVEANGGKRNKGLGKIVCSGPKRLPRAIRRARAHILAGLLLYVPRSTNRVEVQDDVPLCRALTTPPCCLEQT